jgi:cytochrome c
VGLAGILTLGVAGAGCGQGQPSPAPAPPLSATAGAGPAGFRVLVFTKAAGFRHRSIPDGVAAIRRLGREHGFAVDDTADAARLAGQALAGYRAVVFLSTTGDLLDPGQQAGLRRYLQGGGGWVGGARGRRRRV